jgi:hypothetical protein
MMEENKYYIVLDFDGTVVKHRYPDIGEDIGAAPILRRLVKNGHSLLLNTMRSRNCEGIDTLQPAIDWFVNEGIPLYGINENPSQKSWTSSPKVYGNIYIDDAAMGAPLKADAGAPPFIDWNLAAIYLFYQGLLSQNDILELIAEKAIDVDQVKRLCSKL